MFLLEFSIFSQEEVKINDGRTIVLSKDGTWKYKLTSINTFTDQRDGHVYKTVKIGTQTWMAENLAFKPIDGFYWALDNNENNIDKYGYLYDWETAIKVCPNGWHLPSNEEWKVLENYLIANGYNYDGSTSGNKIAKSLATNYEWNISKDKGAIGNDVSRNNSSGFSALPGLNRYNAREEKGLIIGGSGDMGCWWSSTLNSENIPWYCNLWYSGESLGSHCGDTDKHCGLSVRYLKNKIIKQSQKVISNKK